MVENPELYCYTLNNGMEMQQQRSDNIVNTNNSDQQGDSVLTLFYSQQCSTFAKVLQSTGFYICKGSTVNSVLHSTVFYIQQCSTFNIVLHSTLFCIIQQCSTFSRTIEEDVVLVMVVMVFCFNYSVDNYNSDDLFTS